MRGRPGWGRRGPEPTPRAEPALSRRGAGLSDSEAEPDGEHNITQLPQAVAGRGNLRAEQSAVRLTEIGPRMTLQLVKIQEGVGEGSVLFHSFVRKSEEELRAMLAAREERLRLRMQRRELQAQNVQRKREQRAAHRCVGARGTGWGKGGRYGRGAPAAPR